jgi:hypothetical protein
MRQSGLVPGFLAAGLLLSVVPMAAHHGTGASYDQKKWVTIKGAVKEFLWRNPHSGLFLEVKDETGTTSYAIEMYSPGLMVKQGYTRNTFKPGDQVEIDVHPSLAGQPTGECLGCRVLVNGKDPALKPSNP